MHSLAFAENILEVVLCEAEKYQKDSIENIEVSLDEHGFMEAEEIKFCFGLLAKGTKAEGAQMEIGLANENEPPKVTIEMV